MKTRGHQQVPLAQEAFTSKGSETQTMMAPPWVGIETTEGDKTTTPTTIITIIMEAEVEYNTTQADDR